VGPVVCRRPVKLGEILSKSRSWTPVAHVPIFRPYDKHNCPVVFWNLKCAGLLLDGHKPPFTRRFLSIIAPPFIRRSNRKNRTQDVRHLRRHRRRWRVERLCAWLQNFRRLLVRHEYHHANFLVWSDWALSSSCCATYETASSVLPARTERLRQAPGEWPTSFLNARLNAASDS
jgi:hypothetical protein